MCMFWLFAVSFCVITLQIYGILFFYATSKAYKIMFLYRKITVFNQNNLFRLFFKTKTVRLGGFCNVCAVSRPVL